MEGGVEKGIDIVIPKLVDLFEAFAYDVEPEQLIAVFEAAGLEIVSSEDYEDYVHG
jgi:hypothetical protein